jgi:phosphate:Na+ symporter
MRLKYFDQRLMNTPPIAAQQLFREVRRMGEIARGNLTAAMTCFDEYSEELCSTVSANEDVLDYLNKEITQRLIEVNGLELNERDTKMVGSLFHVVVDLERVGDHAMNILEAAQTRQRDEIRFSAKAQGELDSLSAKVGEQLERVLNVFQAQQADSETMSLIQRTEDEIDTETEQLRAHHIDRVKNRKCSARNGAIYLDLLTNLERIADHAENIAGSVPAV